MLGVAVVVSLGLMVSHGAFVVLPAAVTFTQDVDALLVRVDFKLVTALDPSSPSNVRVGRCPALSRESCWNQAPLSDEQDSFGCLMVTLDEQT